MFDEGLLKRMKLAIVGKSFDSQDTSPSHLEGQRRTGADRPPIDKQGTSAAYLNIAGSFDSRKAQAIAYDVEKELMRLDVQLL
jgi:hypothetical protein